MPFRVTTTRKHAGATEHEVFSLADSAGAVRAEVWPGIGGNCLRWSVAGPAEPLELLYSAADWDENPVPTRSGIPVLFPFPNRIRDGRFAWNNQDYQLPVNCPQGRHAIHGFACRSPWRVTGTNAYDLGSSLTMVFRPSIDAPAAAALWPGECQLELIVSLSAKTLRLDATVHNLGETPLSWGLGYHPYFRLPSDQTKVKMPARRSWELQDFLPTGHRLTLDENSDLRTPRVVRDLQLDALYTDLHRVTDGSNLIDFGTLDFGELGALRLTASPPFREALVFTPPHRQAICIEPYTCVTNAINLPDVDGGWQVLASGQLANASFEMQYEPAR